MNYHTNETIRKTLIPGRYPPFSTRIHVSSKKVNQELKEVSLSSLCVSLSKPDLEVHSRGDISDQNTEGLPKVPNL